MSDQPKFGAVLFTKNLTRIATFYQELSMTIGHYDTQIIVLESPTVVKAIRVEI